MKHHKKDDYIHSNDILKFNEDILINDTIIHAAQLVGLVQKRSKFKLLLLTIPALGK